MLLIVNYEFACKIITFFLGGIKIIANFAKIKKQIVFNQNKLPNEKI